jgi:pimeloyl-ACP methyl ester carboxylesterase
VSAFQTGHWVMVEQPDQFRRAVVDWLANVELLAE